MIKDFSEIQEKKKMLNYILDTLEDRKYLLIIGTSSCYHIDRDDRMFLCKLFREIERRTRASDDFEAGFEFGDIGSENDNNYSRAVCHERSITRRQLTLKNRLESRTIRFPKDHPSPFPLLSFSSLNPPRDIRFPRTKTISAPPAFVVAPCQWKMEGLLIFIRSPEFTLLL